jgi:hypothetical protein
MEYPELLDVEADSLLDLFRLKEAARVIDKLRAAEALPKRLAHLDWKLAIRRGDTTSALAAMPKELTRHEQWLILELYYQLLEMGDRGGVETVIKAIRHVQKPSTKALRAWHRNGAIRVLYNLKLGKKDDPYLSALSAHLLRGRAEPEALYEAMKRGAKSAKSLRFDVDLALATWPIEGHAKAARILDGIWANDPDAAPLRHALGEAYLEMGMPKKAVDVIGKLDTPEALAILFKASQSVKKINAKKLVQDAEKSNELNFHPATAYVMLAHEFTLGKYEKIMGQVDSMVERGGKWTAEIAELGAKSINLVGEQGDANKLLKTTARKAAAHAGIGEMWNIKLAELSLNIDRGKKYRRLALDIIDRMEDDGIRDPRLAYNKSIIKMKDGDSDAELRLLEKAIERDPTFRPAYLRLSKMGAMNPETATVLKRTWPNWQP